MKRFIILALALSLLLCGCESTRLTRQVYLMDTIINITLNPDAVEENLDEIENILESVENLASPTKADSSVSVLNSGGKATDELVELITYADELSGYTNGAFDISLGKLISLWDIKSETPRVPEEDEIQNAKLTCGMDKIRVTENSVALENGIEINLGAIAKGYAGDKVYTYLKENSISGIASIGGSVVAHGLRPDDNPWSVGIRSPYGTSAEYMGVLEMTDSIIAVSGDYERFFEKDGIRYHHILDPKTGYPAKSDIKSVAVVSKNGAYADALSTALFVMGKEKAIELWKEKNDFEFIIIDSNRTVTVSQGLSNSFTLTDGGYNLETQDR